MVDIGGVDYDLPEDLMYSLSKKIVGHTWVRKEGDGLLVGLTDFAAKQLGELVFLSYEMGEGDSVVAIKFEGDDPVGDPIGSVESSKTAASLYSPVNGEIVATNEEAEDDPSLINSAPYETWLFRIKGDTAGLLDVKAYIEKCMEAV